MENNKILAHYFNSLLFFILLFATKSAVAQNSPKDTTMNRTVIVEQQYNPKIESVNKINILPQIEEPNISKKDVKYDENSQPIKTFSPREMGVYMTKEKQKIEKFGYARLGYGNYNNIDSRLNYLFILSPKDRLTISGNMNGMNSKLTKPQITEIEQNKEKWNSRFYRAQTEINYLHQFNKINLDISGQLQQENFNYANNIMKIKTTDKQKYTSGNIHFGIKSTKETLPFQFAAETNMLFFNKQYSISGKAAKERIFRTKASAIGSIDEQQKVTVIAQMDNFSYSSQFKNYTSLLLNSFYELRNDDWYLKLGGHLDLAFNYGKDIQISPDLAINYIFSDSYVLYTEAKGGKTFNSFSRMREMHPFSDPEIRMTDSYTQLNATVGFKASPIPNFWFNLYGGYKIVLDDCAPIYTIDQQNISFTQGKSKNFFSGVDFSYEYKSLAKLSISSKLFSWKHTAKSLLTQKPKSEVSINASLQIIPKLKLDLGSQYIQYSTSQVNINNSNTSSYKMPNVINVKTGFTYQLLPHTSIYAQFDNLLNKKYQYYYTYPTEGINFLGGLSFHF
ncbi:TonB-dependent receptor [uncultured Bacteroides sp.]|uniref:TonB-dependent receptor n=1 Tax=uncultured Bacteroides sp. TaxID=162156 RepID=UPI002AAAEB68|nr:TonB-dependent receptor [uncultured Bacteroides sp.]